MSRNRILLLSLALAALAFSTRWSVEAVTGATFTFVFVNGALAVPWFVLLALSLQRYGKSGLWVLAGAPLVLFWPVALYLLLNACDHGAACI